MPRAVVDPRPVSKTFHEIPPHLVHRRISGQSQLPVPPRCPLRHGIIEAYKRLISKPACSFLGRVFIDELLHFFEDVQQLLDKRRDFARVRVWQIENGVPEVGYERDDKMVGGGSAVEGEVVDGCELLGGSGEDYGRERRWRGRSGGDIGGRLGGTIERGRHLSVGLAAEMRLDGSHMFGDDAGGEVEVGCSDYVCMYGGGDGGGPPRG